MTQGLYVKGQRPKSKKAVREAVAEDPALVEVEATSVFDNEFGGPLDELPRTPGTRVTFVGPDPYTSRKFYGNIQWDTRKGRYTVT